MPVIGHALCGLATAACLTPREAPRRAHPLWVPGFVLLAYLPDVVTWLLALAGIDAKVACHAAVVALPAGMLAGVVLGLWGRVSWRWGLAVGGLSIGVHIVLDALQSTDRQLLWPWSDRVLLGDTGWLPAGLWAELLIFGGIVVAARLIGRGHWSRLPRGWLARGAVMTILVAAVGTHVLRAMREAHFQAARAHVIEGRHHRALEALDLAERWPSTGRPGRLAYLRGEAYLGLGQRDQAEVHYGLAVDLAPDFWPVADLALFYATAADAERRAKVGPLLERLQRDFADHEACAERVAKISAMVD